MIIEYDIIDGDGGTFVIDGGTILIEGWDTIEGDRRL